MKIGKFGAFLVTLLITYTSCIAAESVDINKAGTYRIALSVTEKLSVNVSIRVAPYEDSMPYKGFWGTNGTNPKTIVGEIVLDVNGKRIDVPLSSVSCLANASKAKLTQTDMGYRLTIEGGDLSTGYRVMIDFNSGGVIQSEIQSIKSPKQRWEITIYSTPEEGSGQ